MSDNMDTAVARRTAEIVQDLIESNFAFLTAKMDAEDKDTAAVSIAVNYERGPGGYAIGARLSWTSKHSDELEGYVDNPNQIKMEFNPKS